MQENTKNILLINNDENEINKLKELLGNLYNVEVSEKTSEALTLVETNSNKYSIIIVNLQMPELNGYLFCLSVRHDLKITKVPILITGTLVDFSKTEPPKNLRIAEFDKLIRPFEPKTVQDIIELSIEKKRILESIESSDVIDERTGLYTFAYFKEALDLEILRAIKLKYSLNSIKISITESEIRENLLSLIKNTCRYYDTISAYQDTILLLLPKTNEREGELVLNRIYSLIYGLDMEIYLFEPDKTDVMEFKSSILTVNTYTI
jgi:response regulator RpfG family c-di-GMP phosphodiesterase